MKGTIVPRKLADGSKRYHAVFRVNGKQKWKTFNKQKDADRYLTAAVKAAHDGTYMEVRPIKMAEVFDLWFKRSMELRKKQGLLKESTSKSYRSMVNTHLIPAFGDYRSDRLSHAVIGDWAVKMGDEIVEGAIAPKSYNNLLNLFHSILEWARHPAQGYLSHDPLAGQKRIPLPQIERDFLEPSEIPLLLEAADSPDVTILNVALYTGLRRGELFALQWGDVDWGDRTEGGRLWIRRAIYQGKISTPKTKRSVRMVDVPQRILDDLNVYRAMFPPLEGKFVFRTWKGTPLDPDNWYKRHFLEILDRGGIRRMGLHALRHTYASLLINQGESIMYVSRQLGHASIQITADLYGHLFKETSLAAMKRLGASIPGTYQEAI